MSGKGQPTVVDNIDSDDDNVESEDESLKFGTQMTYTTYPMFVNVAAGIFQLGHGIYFGMYLEIWFGAILLVHGLFSVCCLLYDHTMGRYPKRTWGEHWKGGPLGKR